MSIYGIKYRLCPSINFKCFKSHEKKTATEIELNKLVYFNFNIQVIYAGIKACLHCTSSCMRLRYNSSVKYQHEHVSNTLFPYASSLKRNSFCVLIMWENNSVGFSASINFCMLGRRFRQRSQAKHLKHDRSHSYKCRTFYGVSLELQ